MTYTEEKRLFLALTVKLSSDSGERGGVHYIYIFIHEFTKILSVYQSKLGADPPPHSPSGISVIKHPLRPKVMRLNKNIVTL